MNDLDRGPFRRVELADERPAPARFLVRRDDDELVIEGRRAIEAIRSPIFLLPFISGMIGVGTLPWHVHLGRFIFPAVATAAVLLNMATSSGRTTLTLRHSGCSVTYRTLFRTRRLVGSLDSLELLGIVALASLPSHKGRAEDVLGIHLSLGGEQASVFRNVPRAELEWVMAQVRAWRAQMTERETPQP